jgi:hypothetical protein
VCLYNMLTFQDSTSWALYIQGNPHFNISVVDNGHEHETEKNIKWV